MKIHQIVCAESRQRVRTGCKLAGIAIASAIAITCTATRATAQSSEASTATSGEALEEVIVTAQRRAERSQDVPITITAVDADDLKQANVNSLVDLPKLAPGLRFDSQAAYTQPTIRGIGTSIVNVGAGSSVGIYVDGYYLPNSLSTNLQFLNVENIQVLKGPQGTLFGRNTPGGAILVKTADPSIASKAIVDVSYGRYNAQRYQGYASTGLTDKVAVSVEGLYSKGDGFVKNVFAGNHRDGAYENSSIRAGLKAELSDSVSLLLRYMHTDTNDPTGNAVGTYFSNGQPYSAGDQVPGAVFGLKRGEVANDARTSFQNKTDTGQLTFNVDLGFADLTSYTQYRKETIAQFTDGDGSSAPILALGIPEQNRISSQEFLLNSKSGTALQYTTGVFLFEHKSDQQAKVSFGGSPFFDATASGVKSRTAAAFLDMTYQLTQKLFLTGGVRFSRDEIKDPYYQPTFGVPNVFADAPEYKHNKVTPRVVVRYKPSEQSSIYGSFTQGYKAAIYDVRATSGADYLKPEDVNAYEIGYKLVKRAFSTEVSVFKYDYKNLQNAYYLGTSTVYSNAGKSRIQGAEAQLTLPIGEAFEVSARGTYLDAKYSSYLNSGYFVPRYNVLGDFAGFTPTTIDVSGYQMQRAPKYNGTLAAKYSTDLAKGRLSASANLYATDKVYFDSSHQFKQDAYEILSLRVEWVDPTDRFTVAVYADNVTDTQYLTQAYATPTGAVTVWGTPVTYGLSLRAKL